MTEIINKLPEPEPLRLKAAPGKIVARRIREDMVGGLYLPQSARDRSTLARIVSVYDPWVDGEGITRDAFYAEGDVVIFGSTAGIEVDIRQGGEVNRYIALREAEILMKVENFPAKEGTRGE